MNQANLIQEKVNEFTAILLRNYGVVGKVNGATPIIFSSFIDNTQVERIGYCFYAGDVKVGNEITLADGRTKATIVHVLAE